MLFRKLDSIDEADLDALLQNAVPEGKMIDYKTELPGMTDSEKKEFLADISSFANSAGGHLIVGVEEKEGVPISIPGISLADADSEIRRLDSIVQDGLDPRIRYVARLVSRIGKPPVLVIHIERSWIGPHRVVFKGNDKFYARNSAGKYPLDVSELREAFTLADRVEERVRHFRASRVSRLQSGGAPVPLGVEAKTIVHSIPVESFSHSVSYDVLQFHQKPGKLQPPIGGTGWQQRINLDGIVTYSGSLDGPTSYTQLFRNGSVEAVEAVLLNSDYREKREIPYLAFERAIYEYVPQIFDIQKSLGVSPPVFLAITLTGTKGLEMSRDPFSVEPHHPIEDEDLLLPDVLIESFDEPRGNILRPIFDLIWNACGYPRSKNFDEKGNWNQK